MNIDLNTKMVFLARIWESKDLFIGRWCFLLELHGEKGRKTSNHILNRKFGLPTKQENKNLDLASKLAICICSQIKLCIRYVISHRIFCYINGWEGGISPPKHLRSFDKIATGFRDKIFFFNFEIIFKLDHG